MNKSTKQKEQTSSNHSRVLGIKINTNEVNANPSYSGFTFNHFMVDGK